MDFKTIIDNVAAKAGKVAKTAARKTGEAAEHAKLSLAMRAEKAKLEEMYTTLGKLFYEQVKGTDIRAQVAAQVMEIDEQKRTIDELSDEISEIGGKICCEHCGKEMSIEDAYCPDCGKKQEAKKLSPDEKIVPHSDDISTPSTTDADDFVSTFNDITDKYFS